MEFVDKKRARAEYFSKCLQSCEEKVREEKADVPVHYGKWLLKVQKETYLNITENGC